MCCGRSSMRCIMPTSIRAGYRPAPSTRRRSMSESDGSEPKATPTRLIVTGDVVLKMPRHIKLRHDAGRGRWIVLAPERVFNPDDTAVEVLKLLDGQRSVNAIA